MKSLSVVVVAVSVLSLTLLSACSSRYASNGSNQYLGNRNGEALIIPPPLTSSNISHFYDLPSSKDVVAAPLEPPKE